MSTAMPQPAHRARSLTRASEDELRLLAALLIDCVEGDASVSFMHPLDPDNALAFWRGVAESSERGERAVVAEDAQGIVGTGHALLEQPQNQPQRGDVAKMLVHRCSKAACARQRSSSAS